MADKTENIVDRAEKSGVASTNKAVRRWLRRNAEDAELLTCATAWLRHELEGRERRRTLRAERRAESSVVIDDPTPDEAARKREERWAYLNEVDRSVGDRLEVLASRIGDVVQVHAKSLEMTWTPELLGQSISMPDGSTTTWGEATIEQHEIRYGMFTQYAQTNIEGAARHQHAIESLRNAKVATLIELVESEVAA